MAQKFTVPITVKQLASAGSDAVTVYVDQDTYSRLKVEAGGRLTWGSGAAAGDVNLYRDSADVLKTDDTFKAPSLFVDNIEIDPTGAVTNDALVFNGVKFVSASVAGGGGASLTVSDVAPASPSEGDLWFNSSNARTYVYYDSSWVEVGGSGGVANLDDIGNVSASAPVDYSPLVWSVSASAWIANSQDLTLGTPGTTDYVTITSYNSNIVMSSATEGIVQITPSQFSGSDIDNGPYFLLNANNLTFSNGSDSFLIDPYWGTSGQVLAFTPGGGSGGTWGPTTPTLDFLSDVSASAPSDGNFLKYVSASSAWIPASVPTINALDDIGDVSVTSPTVGHYLQWSGSVWTSASASGGSTVTASTTPPSSPESGSIWFDSGTAKTYVYYDSFWVEIGGTSGGAKMYVSETAPSTPLEGQLWFKSDTAQTFAYYDSFWVEVGAAGMAAIAADAAPASPVTGQLWFNTSTGGTYVYYDSAWVEVGAIAANTVFNLVDAKGDLLVGTADNTLARQAVGTNGQLLQANSSATNGVEWITPTYAPAAGPTFTGTVVLPSTTSIGTVTSTEIGYVDGVTSAIQTQLNAKAPLAAPTFTGTVVLPSTTSIGTVDSTEIGYLDGVTSAIQTQLNAKAPTVSPNFTSGLTTSGMTNNGNLNTSGNIQQNMVHGYNFRQELSAGNNGAGTGIAQLNIWISEPGATWTGAGISRNRSNSAGSFPHVNSALSSQMIRFADSSTGGIDFTCTNTAKTQENSFSFDSTGAASKAGGGSWAVLSDVRLKDNIRDYDKGTTELMQVRVCEWEHNGKGGLQAGSKGLGVVANEIELVLPDTVDTYEGKLNPEDEETTDIKRFDSSEITWLLVKTVQEQQATIQALTARIEALEA